MKVFNTLGRSLETFVPREQEKVSIYVCGPTVQSEPHLGHGRAAVAFDVMRRYLRWRGFEVTHVQNVTDIEDKIIAAANERGMAVEEATDSMLNLRKLLARRIDAAALQDVTADSILERHTSYSKNIEKLYPPIITKPYYLMISHQFYKEHPELAKKIWDTIRLIRNTEYESILNKYMHE